MAGSETIVQRILEQAREQVQSLEVDARREAEAEKATAVLEADKQAEAILVQNREDKIERDRRIVAVADLELRKRVLAAKREVLDEAYQKANEALAAMADDKYAEVYLRLVPDAIVKGTEGIAPAQNDQSRLGEAFVKQLNEQLQAQGRPAQVAVLPARPDIDGGCIVCDGGMEIDFSHEAVMRNLRERTEADVAKLLFADGEG